MVSLQCSELAFGSKVCIHNKLLVETTYSCRVQLSSVTAHNFLPVYYINLCRLYRIQAKRENRNWKTDDVIPWTEFTCENAMGAIKLKFRIIILSECYTLIQFLALFASVIHADKQRLRHHSFACSIWKINPVYVMRKTNIVHIHTHTHTPCTTRKTIGIAICNQE